jgi:serine/threonine protein kinase
MIPSQVVASIERYRKARIETTGGRILGKGGHGIVRLGIDPETQKLIAVKHIWGWSDVNWMMREVESLVTLRHPCIVGIIGWSPGPKSNEGEIHLEYAPNGSLSKHLQTFRDTGIRGGFWTPTQIGIIICDIVLGMRYVHSLGILHRDLKPSNILLKGNFRGMISDFGLSRPGYVEGPPTRWAGTELYSAPEQLEENYRPSKKTDVFTFGLVLYEIIGSHAVFCEGIGLKQLVLRLRGHDLPNIPSEFGWLMQELIPRCWAERPGSRPSFQDIFETIAKADFAILPNVDRSAIKDAVFKVLAWESCSDRTDC